MSHPSMQDTEPMNIPRYARGHLSRSFDDYQVHQQIQIEKETLKFLKKAAHPNQSESLEQMP